MSEDLGFSGKTAKGTGMNYPCPITLEGTAVSMRLLGMLSLCKRAARVAGDPAAGQHLLLRAGAGRFFFRQLHPGSIELLLHFVYVAGLGVRRYRARILLQALLPLSGSQF